MIKKMSNYVHLFLLAALAILVLSCGTSPYLKEPVNDQVSLIVGYIDMSDALGGLSWVEFKQLAPPSDQPYLVCQCIGGLFYNSQAVNGVYKLYQFGGGRTYYNLPNQGKMEWDPVIEKPGIVFVGSYKYKRLSTGIFEPGKFSLEKVDHPTEKEVLEKLLPYAGQTTWKDRIQKRIGEL